MTSLGPPHNQAPTPGYQWDRPAPAILPRGFSFGTQSPSTWTAAETDERTIVDAMQATRPWRVSLVGQNVQLRLNYGTKANIQIGPLVLPFVANIPGQISITAFKANAQLPASVSPTLTLSDGAPTGIVRSIIPAAAAPLDERIHRVTALAAATVTVSGQAVVLAPGDQLPIGAPSSLTAGGPLLAEWTL